MTCPIVITTRLGLGIYDHQWWDARLSLFEAITVPSISRFRELDIHWHILIDTDIPDAIYDRLRDIFKTADSCCVHFDFVENHAFTRNAIRDSFRAHASSTQRVIAMMIDDDDAVGRDFFDNILEEIARSPEESAVISMSNGCALNAPESEIGPLYYRSNTCNTVFYGRTSEILKVIFGSHVNWLDIAKGVGLRAIELDQPARQFAYTYHQQGDGSYGSRVGSVQGWRPVSVEDYEWFGIDRVRFNDWKSVQSTVPETFGLTWRRTQPEQFEMARLFAGMREIKKSAIDTNSSLFVKNTPFLYVLYPLQSDKRSKGYIAFHGVATPGLTVAMYATGKSGVFREMGRSQASSVTGSFGIKPFFNAGTWIVRFVLLDRDGETPMKILEYGIIVHS